MDSIGLYILLVVLIILSGLFSATETAFSCVNRIRLKNYASDGNKKAKMALEITENFDKALSAILIGNNVVNIASASIGTVVCTDLFGASGAAIATLAMTIIVLIFGEILPKSYAKENAESFALRVANMLHMLIIFLTPFVWIFTQLKKLISKEKSDNTPSVTEEELKYIIEEIKDEGVLESSESELVQSALEFDETSVEEIITHRVDMDAVEIDKPLEELKELFFHCTHSRIPVYEKKVDNIIGIVHQRDFFKALLQNGTVDLRHIMQEVLYVPTTLKISELMKEFQRRKCHVAIVTDQYGGVTGIATFEDILEELVGDIWDETDEVETPIVKLSENIYDVSADINIHDFFEEIEYEPAEFESKSNTLGGFVLELLERIPKQGDHVSYGRLSMIVQEIEDNRMIRLTVTKISAETEE